MMSINSGRSDGRALPYPGQEAAVGQPDGGAEWFAMPLAESGLMSYPAGRDG